MRKTQVQSLGRDDALEKEMATHSSTLSWEIPRMEEPGGLQSIGSQRVGHDWATSVSFCRVFCLFVCLLVYLCFCLYGLRLGLSHSLLYLVAQNGSRLLNICWLNEWGDEWPPNLELSWWDREREGKGVGGYVVWQHQMSQRRDVLVHITLSVSS